MKSVKVMLLGASLLMLSACGPQVQKESEATVTEKSNSEAVIETILSRPQRPQVQTGSSEPGQR